MTRTRQNAPLLERVISQVIITDPTHPLSGLTFPLVRVTRSSRDNPSLIIKLPNGDHRRVRCSATDIDGPRDVKTSAAALVPISVRTILPLAQRVRSMLLHREENIDEARSHSTDYPVHIAIASSTPSAAVAAGLPARALEQSGAAASTAVGSTLGRTNPAHPPTGSKRQKGGRR